MDKIQLTKEALENNAFDFKTTCFIPYKDKEEMAEKLAQAAVICDPEGVAYISYRYDLARMFLIAEYYTNIDTTDWDTEDGQKAVFDYMTNTCDGTESRYEKMCRSNEFMRDMAIVDSIFNLMSKAITIKHGQTSSLSYRIGKVFNSILGDDDIVKTLAESREVSEKLIDIISVLNKSTQSSGTPTAQGMLSFAKK